MVSAMASQRLRRFRQGRPHTLLRESLGRAHDWLPVCFGAELKSVGEDDMSLDARLGMIVTKDLLVTGRLLAPVWQFSNYDYDLFLLPRDAHVGLG